MRVLSLFDGISCAMVALERAGFEFSEYFAYEIDKYAIKVSQKNYPQIQQCGSVVGADFKQHGEIDLLAGGSPCQDLSISKGKNRQGLKGEKSSLFWEYVRALREVEPKYFIFENVASMSKEDKAIITAELDVEPIMINSALVSAQQRKRLYWTNIPNVEQPEDKGLVLQDILKDGLAYDEKSYCLTARYQGAHFEHDFKRKQKSMVAQSIRLGELDGKKGQAHRVYSVRGKSVNISANGGGIGGKTGLYKIDLPNGDYIIRKLTPIECERLQTLPDNYTEGISNTQRYKALGNGWTVDVISHILGNMRSKQK